MAQGGEQGILTQAADFGKVTMSGVNGGSLT